MSIRKYIVSSATWYSASTSLFALTSTILKPVAAVHRASMSSMSQSSLSTPGSTPNSEGGSAKTNPIAAVAQLRSTSDKFRNLLDVATCARLAKSKGASMLFLPECFGFIGESSSQTLEEAEDPARLSIASSEAKSVIGTETESAGDYNSNKKREEELELTRILKSIIHNASDCDGDGDVDDHNKDMMSSNESSPVVHSLMDGLRTIAKESGIWISGGGIHVSGAPPDVDNSAEESGQQQQQRVYNTHVILDSSGALIAHYRKIHLFDVSIPGKVELRESKTTAPGTELVACDSPVGRLGITTCYDMRFPEMYTELTRTMGAQVLLVPSAFTIPTGAAHWHTLLRGE